MESVGPIECAILTEGYPDARLDPQRFGHQQRVPQAPPVVGGFENHRSSVGCAENAFPHERAESLRNRIVYGEEPKRGHRQPIEGAPRICVRLRRQVGAFEQPRQHPEEAGRTPALPSRYIVGDKLHHTLRPFECASRRT